MFRKVNLFIVWCVAISALGLLLILELAGVEVAGFIWIIAGILLVTLIPISLIKRVSIRREFPLPDLTFCSRLISFCSFTGGHLRSHPKTKQEGDKLLIELKKWHKVICEDRATFWRALLNRHISELSEEHMVGYRNLYDELEIRLYREIAYLEHFCNGEMPPQWKVQNIPAILDLRLRDIEDHPSTSIWRGNYFSPFVAHLALIYRQKKHYVISPPTSEQERQNLVIELKKLATWLHDVQRARSEPDNRVRWHSLAEDDLFGDELTEAVNLDDACSLITGEIAYLEKNRVEATTGRGALDWTEQGSYQTAEPEPPPKWDS